MKKNILIIHHGEGLGGGLTALLGLIDELKVNHNITVLSIFKSEANEYISKRNVEHVVLDSFFYKKLYKILTYSEAEYYSFTFYLYLTLKLILYYFNKYIYAPLSLNKIIIDKDIVYLNSTFLSDWAYFSYKKGAKVIAHVREPFKRDNTIFSYCIRINLKKYVTHIIAISKDNALRLNFMHKTSVVYDPVFTANRKSLNSFKRGTSFKYFVYVGGSSRIKGFEQLVKSLPYLNDDIKILVLGNIVRSRNKLKLLCAFLLRGSYVFKEQKLLYELSKSKKVISIGLAENVFDYIIQSKALISPFSKPHASLPILEAFSLRKPVIASNVSGTEELVSDNYNGFIFNNNDYINLAQKVNTLAELNDKEYTFLCANAYETYRHVVNKNNTVTTILCEKVI